MLTKTKTATELGTDIVVVTEWRLFGALVFSSTTTVPNTFDLEI